MRDNTQFHNHFDSPKLIPLLFSILVREYVLFDTAISLSKTLIISSNCFQHKNIDEIHSMEYIQHIEQIDSTGGVCS